MVEQNSVYLNNLFGSLADPTRRDILRRLIGTRLTISQLAANYNISFAAIAKHLAVLERAALINKERQGREQLITIAPEAIKDASHYLKQYEQLWNSRFNRVDRLLKGDI